VRVNSTPGGVTAPPRAMCSLNQGVGGGGAEAHAAVSKASVAHKVSEGGRTGDTMSYEETPNGPELCCPAAGAHHR